MIKTPITIQNQLGLHARASAKLVKEASRYASKITLVAQNAKIVNAKSIMGIMALGAKLGTTLTLVVDGEDEENAAQNILDLINDKFGEQQED